jgi:sugar phosphate isomerase/epimerase
MLDSPAGIVALADRVRGSHPNFGVLFDTCNADLCARAGGLANPVELLRQLQGRVTHIHVADSDGLGRHVPPGEGKLRWDSLVPALLATGAEWWTIDLGDWPEAFDAISESKRFLGKLLKKYAAG